MNNLISLVLLTGGLFYFLSSSKIEQIGGNIYLEESRGNPKYKQYPPCYDICGASRKIHDILVKNNLVRKYHSLLEGHSLVLCQEVYIMKKPCENTMLTERLEETKTQFGEIKMTNDIKKIVEKNTGGKGSYTVTKFLENITAICEREIKNIMKDDKLNDDDKKTIKQMNDTFYQVHYGVVADKC
jgi:hypothetical protein